MRLREMAPAAVSQPRVLISSAPACDDRLSCVRCDLYLVHDFKCPFRWHDIVMEHPITVIPEFWLVLHTK